MSRYGKGQIIIVNDLNKLTSNACHSEQSEES